VANKLSLITGLAHNVADFKYGNGHAQPPGFKFTLGQLYIDSKIAKESLAKKKSRQIRNIYHTIAYGT
jgi:hypothetical protein